MKFKPPLPASPAAATPPPLAVPADARGLQGGAPEAMAENPLSPDLRARVHDFRQRHLPPAARRPMQAPAGWSDFIDCIHEDRRDAVRRMLGQGLLITAAQVSPSGDPRFLASTAYMAALERGHLALMDMLAPYTLKSDERDVAAVCFTYHNQRLPVQAASRLGHLEIVAALAARDARRFCAQLSELSEEERAVADIFAIPLRDLESARTGVPYALRAGAREEARQRAERLCVWRDVAGIAPPLALLDYDPAGVNPLVYRAMRSLFSKESGSISAVASYAYLVARRFGDVAAFLDFAEAAVDPESRQPFADALALIAGCTVGSTPDCVRQAIEEIGRTESLTATRRAGHVLRAPKAAP